MEKRKKVFLSIGLIILLVVVLFVVLNTITKYTGLVIGKNNLDVELNSYEICLDEKNIILYINDENPKNVLNELNLIDYLSKFDIINCARDNTICKEYGMQSFPTWIIDDKIIAGDITNPELKEITGC